MGSQFHGLWRNGRRVLLAGFLGCAACGNPSGGASPAGGATSGTGGSFAPPPGITTAAVTGAALVPVDYHTDDPDAITASLIVDSRGHAHLALCYAGASDDANAPPYQIALFGFDPATGWTAAGAVPSASSPHLAVDNQDTATLVWSGIDGSPGFMRYAPGAGWSALDGPPMTFAYDPASPAVAGRDGLLVVAAASAEPYSLSASVLDPSNGWSQQILASESAPAAPLPSLVSLGGVTIAGPADGYPIVAWTQTVQATVSTETTAQVYALSSSTGWSTPTAFPADCENGSIWAGKTGSVVALGVNSTGDGGADSGFTICRFDNGTWTEQEIPVAIGSLESLRLATDGGAVVLVWDDDPTRFVFRSIYVTPTRWSAIDLPAQPYRRVGPPRLAIDGQGRVVAAWAVTVPTEGVAGQPGAIRGGVTHLFYARYAPGSGWTPPTQIDGDDGLQLLGAIYDLAINESGVAMVVWFGCGAAGSCNSVSTAVLP